MKYIQYINELIVKKTASTERLVLFGQNIAAGSNISGLTKNLAVGQGGLIINTPNSESTLAGLGFGMMLDGTSSIFFMKQLDFLLLGIDQLVDTYNFVRRKTPAASYTIVCVVSDLGWHGLQSSFNNFGDMCSIARISGFNITNRKDAEEIINTHLVSPGFRIICVSQRLFPKEILDVETIFINRGKTLFQYKQGKRATIACFNLAFPQGLELHNKLKEKGIDASLFSVNAATPIRWDEIIADVQKTKKLVVIDDSKSENLSCDNLLVAAYEKCKMDHVIALKRDIKGNEWLSPNADELEINYDEIVRTLSKQN
ncbi:MAG: hypothetical protein A3B25_03275 [Candidatus Ryanbacteria bacterium RIFCSPLOWO2_01_FULL_48_26]|uniref:Transketolase-like pyrimidine-binding domain-containing protein n=1 Tax=Candidatus Ryanbacteria bacterium RIFCSPLOWO2_01_FULL_48_26 TaxID=1802126 RepID=A0A1G2GT50_9BACT|nr:MAG: hypothetical protein A3B25_03275 [Candidatus Ryanbacteria bacterium RIFCSPLOWO2_01_FULL_48_26]